MAEAGWTAVFVQETETELVTEDWWTIEIVMAEKVVQLTEVRWMMKTVMAMKVSLELVAEQMVTVARDEDEVRQHHNSVIHICRCTVRRQWEKQQQASVTICYYESLQLCVLPVRQIATYADFPGFQNLLRPIL